MQTERPKLIVVDEMSEWDPEKFRNLSLQPEAVKSVIQTNLPPEFAPMEEFLGHDWEWHAKTLNRHSRRKLAKLHRQKQKKGKRNG